MSDKSSRRHTKSLIVLVVLWAGTIVAGSVLLHADFEGWAKERYPTARAGAFEGINRLRGPAILVWTGWIGLGLSLCAMKRVRPLIALASGPALSATVLSLTEDWRDPAWFGIVAIMTIGAFAGLVITGAWTLLTRCTKPQTAPSTEFGDD